MSGLLPRLVRDKIRTPQLAAFARHCFLNASEAALVSDFSAPNPMPTPNKIRVLPIRRHLAALAVAVAAAPITQAALWTYTSDANTLHLYTFEEQSGMSSTANLGTKGGRVLTVKETSTDTRKSETVQRADMLGHTGLAGFGNAVKIAHVGSGTNPAGNEGVGFDFNGNGFYSQGMFNRPAEDRITDFRTYFPGSYTLEAMINLPSIANPGGATNGRSIISFDSSTENSRSVFFRVSAGELHLVNANNNKSVGISLVVAIPTAGPEAFEPNVWFHVAVVHDAADGGSTQFYWTRVDPSRSQATPLGPRFTGPQTPNNVTASPALALGADSRHAFSESLGGLLDNVRISSVARGPGDFIFYSQDIGLSVARDGHDVSLGWTPPKGVTNLVNIYRHTKPEKDGRIQLAAIHVDSGTFADRLPSDAAPYWYWVGYIDRSGNYVEHGPYEAKPTSVWQP